MQVQFKLTIGENEFILVEDVETNADFFKKLSFYSTLPKVGPNGETDLVIQHRVAQKQYDYYSIVSKKAGMEFKFGQSKDTKGGLFAKGWEPLYQSEDAENIEESSEDAPREIKSVGLGSSPKQATPTPAATKNNVGLGATNTQAATTNANAKVKANAASILSKFGV